MISERFEQRANALAVASQRVLQAFKDGRNPTFEQIDRLEASLFPWNEELICGHKIIEECECSE